LETELREDDYDKVSEVCRQFLDERFSGGGIFRYRTDDASGKGQEKRQYRDQFDVGGEQFRSDAERVNE
jgi:hypothetical protein